MFTPMSVGDLIGALPLDLFKHGAEHRENLHVPVVVHGGLAVGLQMEGVDHVHVVEVGGGGLVGQVHRVLQRQVPDGEGLELGVARRDAALVLMVELAEAGGHFAAAGAGRRHHHQGVGGLDILVFASPSSLTMGDVGGVAGDGVVAVAADAQGFQPLQKRVRRAGRYSG
jgi:hypothetical protein